MSAPVTDDPFASQRERQASLEDLARAIARAQAAGPIIRIASDGARMSRPAIVALYLDSAAAPVLARLLER